MIKDYDVVLRGHHLILLYNLYYLDQEAINRLAMRKKKYSKEHINFTMNFLKTIANTDINVKIVGGALDNICTRCNRKNKARIGCYSNGEDFQVILKTGLLENEVYSSKYILRKLGENQRHYIYLGDKSTGKWLKNKKCRAVLREDRKCIRAGSKMLVEFPEYGKVIVLARRLRKIDKIKK